MEQGSTTSEADGTGLFAGEAWFDPIEAGIRERVRGFIEELLEGSVKNLGRYAARWIAGWPNRPSSTAALT